MASNIQIVGDGTFHGTTVQTEDGQQLRAASCTLKLDAKGRTVAVVEFIDPDIRITSSAPAAAY